MLRFDVLNGLMGAEVLSKYKEKRNELRGSVDSSSAMHIYFFVLLHQFLEQLDGPKIFGQEISLAHVLDGVVEQLYSALLGLFVEELLGDKVMGNVLIGLDAEDGRNALFLQ